MTRPGGATPSKGKKGYAPHITCLPCKDGLHDRCRGVLVFTKGFYVGEHLCHCAKVNNHDLGPTFEVHLDQKTG